VVTISVEAENSEEHRVLDAVIMVKPPLIKQQEEGILDDEQQ
jgi:hypothetical protein